MFHLSKACNRVTCTSIPRCNRNFGERLSNADLKSEIGHWVKIASNPTLCPKSCISIGIWTICYGRQLSKMIWSAQRAATRRSFSLRTVHVSKGRPNNVRASSGVTAGKSLTE